MHTTGLAALAAWLLSAGIPASSLASAAEKKSGQENGKAEKIEPPAVSKVEPPAVSKVEPALPPDAAGLKIIESLGENRCAKLPATRIVGEWNELTRQYHLDKKGPTSRNYCNKLVWAPERRRALFCGANHGSPHRLNDVWEFDLAANSWIMLHPPDSNDNRRWLSKEKLQQIAEVKDGVLRVKKSGAPVRTAHSWWQITYDPQLKALLWMDTWPGGARSLVKRMGGDVSKLYEGPPLWAYFPGDKQWEQPTPKSPYPSGAVATLLEYVPDLNGTIYYNPGYGRYQTWLFQSESKTWKNLNPKKATSMPVSEMVGCWDSVNRLLVVHSGTGKKKSIRTCHYDPKTNAWATTQEERTEGKIPFGADTVARMYFDPIGKVSLLLTKGRSAKKGGGVARPPALWRYDAAKKEWKTLSPKGAWPPEMGKATLCWFDPAHNVFVVNTCTNTWVYRHKKLEEKPAEGRDRK
jgi:hypothetical protein